MGKSRPTRIPVQTQISPERETELREQALAKELRFRRWFFYRRVGIVLLALGLPLTIVIYASVIGRSKEKSDLLGSVLITEPLERLLHDNDIANLIEYSESLQEDVASNMLPRQLSALEDRRRIAEKLIELRQDEISFKFGVISKIDILMTKCSFNSKHNMDQSGFRDELVEFSNHYVSDPDPGIRTQASLGLLTAQIHDYLLETTDGNLLNVKHQLDATADLLNECNGPTLILTKFIPLMSLSNRDDHVREFKWMIGSKLKAMDDPQDWKNGADIHDRLELGDIDYETLRRLVLARDEVSIEKLKQLVDAISASKFVSATPYRNTLSIVEDLSQIDANELRQTLAEKLRDSADAITHAQARKTVADLVADYDKRTALEGKPFDLGLDSIATSETSGKDYGATIVLFFSLQVTRSTDVVSLLSSRDFLPLPPTAKIRFVLVSIDEFPAAEVTARIKTAFGEVVENIIVTPPESAHFLKQCPISTVPYMIIVDRNRRVFRANVDIEKLREEIQALFK